MLIINLICRWKKIIRSANIFQEYANFLRSFKAQNIKDSLTTQLGLDWPFTVLLITMPRQKQLSEGECGKIFGMKASGISGAANSRSIGRSIGIVNNFLKN